MVSIVRSRLFAWRYSPYGLAPVFKTFVQEVEWRLPVPRRSASCTHIDGHKLRRVDGFCLPLCCYRQREGDDDGDELSSVHYFAYFMDLRLQRLCKLRA